MLPHRPTAAPPLGKAGRGRPYRDPVQGGGAPHRLAGPPTRQAARGSHRPKPQPVAQEVDFEARGLDINGKQMFECVGGEINEVGKKRAPTSSPGSSCPCSPLPADLGEIIEKNGHLGEFLKR